MPIDLHTHSTASDGTLDPAGVVRAAGEAGLTTVALTDHDTYAGWAPAAAVAPEAGVDLVRGIEISCAHRGVGIHLLGYLPDPTDRALGRELERARNSRESRMERMVARLAADGLPVSMAAVAAQTGGRETTVGRPHLADALVAAGLVADRDEAFATYLHRDSPYFVSHYAVGVLDAVRLVRQAGGVPVMAHPFAAARGYVVDDTVIAAMAAAGLAGLEVWHRDHTPAQQQHGLDLADRLGLLVTGSSDFHGTGKPNRLGEHTTQPQVLAQILEQVTSGVDLVRA